MNELTEKEQLVLELVQQGLTNSKIAIEGKIHPTQVHQYLTRIKLKLGVTSKSELIALKKEVRHEG